MVLITMGRTFIRSRALYNCGSQPPEMGNRVILSNKTSSWVFSYSDSKWIKEILLMLLFLRKLTEKNKGFVLVIS